MGMGVTMVVSSRSVRSQKSRVPSGSLPRPRWMIIQRAMSSAQERIPPAAFMLSFSSMATGVGLPPSTAWGMATFRPSIAAVWRGRLEVRPAFFRMRSGDELLPCPDR